MKKILFVLIAILVITGITMPASYQINSSLDTNNLKLHEAQAKKKKKKKSSKDPKRINNSNSMYPVFSPDGRCIVYRNGSDGDKLYKKVFNNNSNGVAINSIGSFNPSFSPDGNYIIYNDQEGNLYKKNANDASDGEKINIYPNGSQHIYSPDGNYIYYISDGDDVSEIRIPGMKIFKKNINDSSDGQQITFSTKASGLTISPDGLYLVYTDTPSGRLYKKNTNDTDDGATITNRFFSGNPKFSPDGKKVAYDINWEIRIKALGKSGDGNKLYDSKKRVIWGAFVAYSPNGKYLVFVGAKNKNLYKRKL